MYFFHNTHQCIHPRIIIFTTLGSFPRLFSNDAPTIIILTLLFVLSWIIMTPAAFDTTLVLVLTTSWLPLVHDVIAISASQWPHRDFRLSMTSWGLWWWRDDVITTPGRRLESSGRRCFARGRRSCDPSHLFLISLDRMLFGTYPASVAAVFVYAASDRWRSGGPPLPQYILILSYRPTSRSTSFLFVKAGKESSKV